MSFVKKLKDILFEEEEYTEPIKIREEKNDSKKLDLKPVNFEEIKEENDDNKPMNLKQEEKDLFKVENTFKFPDFDEEEFASSVQTRTNTNVLNVERKKVVEKRNEYNRLERVEAKEVSEKKKFKPSPIISPVYGILNQDYKAEDIIKKEEVASNIDIDTVRKKAYPKEEVKKEEKIEDTIDTINEPVVTFFDEKNNDVETLDDKKENYKSIDALLEEASSEINIEDTLEMPKTNNIEVIEEELEKIDNDEKDRNKDLEETLDSDLFELIDSMYDDREEG